MVKQTIQIFARVKPTKAKACVSFFPEQSLSEFEKKCFGML